MVAWKDSICFCAAFCSFDEDYEQHAINYKVKGYKKEQKAAQKQIESFQATIDLNEELVKKLKDQLPYQVGSTKYFLL